MAFCKQLWRHLKGDVILRVETSLAFVQEMNDDFINDNVFEEKAKDRSLETMKLKELPTWVIYKILEVVEVDWKFGRSKILTLKNREGETVRVWACSKLNRENKPWKDTM